jgi:hypothetical protein
MKKKNKIIVIATIAVIILSMAFFPTIKRLLASQNGSSVNGNQSSPGGIYESYGRGWLVQIPDEKEEILKVGDWNTLRIIVKGDNVKTYLNGEEMVDLYDEKIGAAQGRIALQIHDGGGIKVLWRNLILQTL